ncbi:amp dependent CoA ligase [Rhizodiscina lignyota]|uniref:Amp dependent CoA ligase n=1 Tax=Rhizodiscina lignyota TaxID=1504668 RepID=A0A9P4M8Z7_9PEZI|nr:amp dependent CoA ligase [Rhizodiscina lignyota]
MPFFAEEHVQIPTQDILSWIFDRLPYDPDKKIYIDASKPERNITASQAKTLIRKGIAGLRAAGLKLGDTVCIHSFNDIYYPILVLSIIGCGGRFTGTNPAYTSYELKHHLGITKAKFIFSESDILPNVQQAATQLGISQSNIFIFNPRGEPVTSGYQSWNSLFNHGEQDWIRFDDKHTAEQTVAALFTTSGTTGLPKALTCSTKYRHTLVIEHNALPYQAAGEVRRIIPLPMFHAAVGPAVHTSALRAGQQNYIMRRFDLEGFLSAVEKYQITDLVCVPPIVIAVIMSPLRHKYSLKSVRFAAVGAAPLDKGPQAKFRELLHPDVPFTQVLGMTETSCLLAKFDGRTFDDTGSIGQFVPDLDIKLVDGEDRDITAWGVTGELCVRGAIVVKGYFENEEGTKKSWDKDGFYHSGDMAYGDGKTKKWYIVDRKKELIKVRGFQVAPPELEGVLLDHPGISDAAVIGIVPPGVEGQGSELPRAYVVRKKGTGDKLTEEEVKAHIAQRLAKYKWLEGGVSFIDAVPRTASGKILKRFLRDRAARETGSKL